MGWGEVAALAEAVTAAVALVALFFAGRQLWQARGATAADRAIAAHRDLTTGEVGEARDRLTTLLWQEGEKAFGRNVCWRPLSFEELLPPDGRLAKYHSNVLGHEKSEPMRDLFKILWSFERIEAVRSGGGADEKLLLGLVAFHAAWWDAALRHITPDDVRARGALAALARWAAATSPGMVAFAARDFPTDADLSAQSLLSG